MLFKYQVNSQLKSYMLKGIRSQNKKLSVGVVVHTCPRFGGRCFKSKPIILNFVPQKLEDTSASLDSSGKMFA